MKFFNSYQNLLITCTFSLLKDRYAYHGYFLMSCPGIYLLHTSDLSNSKFLLPKFPNFRFFGKDVYTTIAVKSFITNILVF